MHKAKFVISSYLVEKFYLTGLLRRFGDPALWEDVLPADLLGNF